jgi:hypothetical protein
MVEVLLKMTLDAVLGALNGTSDVELSMESALHRANGA